MKKFLIGIALLSIPSHASAPFRYFGDSEGFTDPLAALIRMNLRPTPVKPGDDTNLFINETINEFNDIKTVIPIIKDTTYESLSKRDRAIVDAYIQKIKLLAEKSSLRIRRDLKHINIKESEIAEKIKSLISNIPSFKKFNDWCSQNKIKNLDFYSFLQNTFELFLKLNITDQSEPWNKDYPFPWKLISEEPLYSGNNGFDPLAIAVILPYLNCCNRIYSNQVCQIFREFDPLKISHLIKGMINYTIDTIKDSKIFNEYTIPTIIGSLRKLNFLEVLERSPDEKKSLIETIDKQVDDFINKYRICTNEKEKKDAAKFEDMLKILLNILNTPTDEEMTTNCLNLIKDNLSQRINHYLNWGGIFADTAQNIISTLQIVYKKEELQEPLNTIVNTITELVTQKENDIAEKLNRIAPEEITAFDIFEKKEAELQREISRIGEISAHVSIILEQASSIIKKYEDKEIERAKACLEKESDQLREEFDRVAKEMQEHGKESTLIPTRKKIGILRIEKGMLDEIKKLLTDLTVYSASES